LSVTIRVRATKFSSPREACILESLAEKVSLAASDRRARVANTTKV
jgi:hypothetical protein